ncbi:MULTISPECIES: hypothetical protein [unclassified Streptomyces]|nr:MULTISPECIES: hypothetical protein [unclassified Streptomyces]
MIRPYGPGQVAPLLDTISDPALRATVPITRTLNMLSPAGRLF